MPKKEINYTDTIIYKIVCNDLNVKDLYVGHTTNFTKRKNRHKWNCNNPNSKSYNVKVYKTIRENGGWVNWSIIEIEKFECKDRNEASARERHWFETLQAKLNTLYPNRTKNESGKQYRDDNKDKKKEYDKLYRKQYYVNNNDAIKEKREERFTCICGSKLRIHSKLRHLKTPKHHLFLATSEEDVVSKKTA